MTEEDKMSAELIKSIEAKFMKSAVVDVKSGDVVKVHQKIKEGNKERVQIFEGLVIRTDRGNSLTSSITVRRIASGVGVEKTFLMHSPTVLKVEVVRRNKVRRNYLSYMRALSGKSTKLSARDFDRFAVNDVHDAKAEAEEERLEEAAEVAHEAEAKEEAAEAVEAKA
jgi:large subunit ribosomal protein L19